MKNSVNNPTFTQVKAFCLEWGFDVEDEWHNGIPYVILGKMRDDAKSKYGDNFAKFMMRVTDTTDGTTYVGVNSWSELESTYNEFTSK